MEMIMGGALPKHTEPGRRGRVLLGEDDPVLRDRIVERLGAEGYEVVALQNGAEVIGVLCRIAVRPRLTPDVVVMDVRIPFASGVEILASMRAASWSLPVVIVGPAGDPVLEERVERLGAVYVATGQAVCDVVCKAVRRATGGGQARVWRAASAEGMAAKASGAR